jgi:hypothetical protein
MHEIQKLLLANPDFERSDYIGTLDFESDFALFGLFRVSEHLLE